jgi:fructokinase
LIEVDAPVVKVVDTIGAGDSFQAALLAALHRLDRIERKRLRDISAAELRRALSFACKCAAFTCTRAGADPPRSGELAADDW